MGLNQVLRRPLQPPGQSRIPQIAAMRAYIEREEAVLCDFIAKVKATRSTLAQITRELERTDIEAGERTQLEIAHRNVSARSVQLDTQANLNWTPGSRRPQALRHGRIVLAESGVLLLDPCGLWSGDPAVPVLKSSTVGGVRLGDVVLPESVAAKDAVSRLEAAAWNEAANAAEARGNFDKAQDFHGRAAAIFSAIGGHTMGRTETVIISNPQGWRKQAIADCDIFVRGHADAEVDAERDRARRNAAELRRAAESARKNGDSGSASTFQSSSMQADLYADCLQQKLMQRINTAPKAIRGVGVGPFGQRIAGMANLGVMPRHLALASARLGQYPATPEQFAAAEAAILALIPTMSLADAFVKYTLDTMPAYIDLSTLGVAESIPQIERALLFFERNYASKQNVRRAASWGVRFPEDLRADLAYSRTTLTDKYDELFGSMDIFDGSYSPEIGGFDPNSPEDKAADAALGPTPTIAVDAGGGNFSYIVSLTGTTLTLSLWYAHVYRSLQIFVPVLAKMMVNADIPAEDIYGALQLPVKDAPKFILWVVAANTFMFERLQSPKALRGLLDDAMLKDVLLGFDDAARIWGAEAYFLKKKGLEIKATISWLEAIEFITKILALPAKIIQNLPKLGEVDWEKIALYAGIGLGATGVVGVILWSIFK